MLIELTGHIRAVCVGSAGSLLHGRRRIESAFVKHPVDGRVSLGLLGLPGDEHVYEDHGGPDMAVLVYSHEHYAFWRTLGLELPEAGAFAENLTVTGLVEDNVHLGDVFEVGTSVVQVTQPRLPCYKIAARYGRKHLAVEAQDAGFIGYLLRVLAEGDVGAGDTMRLVDRQPHGVTVAEAGRVANVDRNDLEGARRVLAVDALGSSVRRKLEDRVAAADHVGLDIDRLYVPEDTPPA
jgi:MOSC domain-containing protein YiiM